MNPVKHIHYDNRSISYEVIRSRRKKTVSIQVEPQAVTVRAPLWLSDGNLRTIVEKKARWITDKQRTLRRESELHPVKRYVAGEEFPYLGKQHRLVVRENGISPGEHDCTLVEDRLVVTVQRGLPDTDKREATRQALLDWYRTQAERKITARLPKLASLLGLWPQAIEVKDQRNRWGSCSFKGVLRFNWRIITAPLYAVDYLIAHELCHLRHRNHSALFWSEVERAIPDQDEIKIWFRENYYLMTTLS
ncbi:MAG: SprT family zinc-dependent metalloprotease [Smithellaceae bacterium]|nr:SprT family zinc-dependent metalloprotease [Smithellaceae bacterium]